MDCPTMCSSTRMATASSSAHSTVRFAEAGLPVDAEAVGMPCSLDVVEFDGHERRGLVAVVTLAGRRQRLSLLDVVITDESHDAARLLAAFRRWWVPLT